MSSQFRKKKYRFWLTTGAKYGGEVLEEGEEFLTVFDERTQAEVIIRKSIIASAEALT